VEDNNNDFNNNENLVMLSFFPLHSDFESDYTSTSTSSDSDDENQSFIIVTRVMNFYDGNSLDIQPVKNGNKKK